jgi:hypothetical protein
VIDGENFANGKTLVVSGSAPSLTISPALSGQLHQHLSQILAFEQPEKGRQRILDAMLDGFLPRHLAFAYPPRHVFLELGQQIEVVCDNETLEPDRRTLLVADGCRSECFKLIAQIAWPLQPIINIEKPWLPSHAFPPNPFNPMESEKLPID